ncbi:hypothetical protein BTO01_25580 [Vibrio jasicida]|uniref:hypothetical protein n=1 Tax=Vibrio jasicida TaxID=766224 RepID=UPI000CF37E53|nr:hypothetical protein [Vibrio jasicida]PQJ50313.1 hypothetical protein BTO01_25580 [Vibrio jasicida]
MKRLFLASLVSATLIGCGGSTTPAGNPDLNIPTAPCGENGECLEDGLESTDDGFTNPNQPIGEFLPDALKQYTTVFTDELFEVAAIHGLDKESLTYICNNEANIDEWEVSRPFLVSCEVTNNANRNTGVKDLLIKIPSVMTDNKMNDDFWKSYQSYGFYYWDSAKPETLAYQHYYQAVAQDDVEKVTASEDSYITHVNEASTAYYGQCDTEVGDTAGVCMEYAAGRVSVEDNVVTGFFQAEVKNEDQSAFSLKYHLENLYWLRGDLPYIEAYKQDVADKLIYSYEDIYTDSIVGYYEEGQPTYSTRWDRQERLFFMIDKFWK